MATTCSPVLRARVLNKENGFKNELKDVPNNNKDFNGTQAKTPDSRYELVEIID